MQGMNTRIFQNVLYSPIFWLCVYMLLSPSTTPSNIKKNILILI